MNFDIEYSSLLDYFNQKLFDFLGEYIKDCPKILGDSMIYAVEGGGKRVRPVLCLATAKMLGVDVEKAVYYAIAIELVHSYSLVHDDLPAMDNDDYRRGKLSTHKKFGEAFGILAGDGLLNLAIEACFQKDNVSFEDFNAIKTIFEYTGAKGMVKGQVLDLENEDSDFISEQVLNEIHLNKTAKLITAPILASSHLAKDRYYEELKTYGENLGILFQYTDDVLDVEGSFESLGKTPNKDEKENKLTSVKVYGLNGVKERIDKIYNKCQELLNNIPNSEFLQSFTKKIYLRKS